MDIFECQRCNHYFNTRARIPQILPCGDTCCSICLSELLDNESITCPFDSRSFTGISSTETLPVNQIVQKNLEVTELDCISHPGTYAVFLDIQKAEAYCEACSTPGSQKIQYENLTDQLISSLLSSSDFPGISEDYRKKIRDSCIRKNQKNNKQKLKLLKELYFMIKTIFCDKHKQEEAVCINFETKELLCEKCAQGGGVELVEIQKEEFFATLINKIMWVRRGSDRIEKSILSLDISELKTMSIKTLVVAYQALHDTVIKSPTCLKGIKCKACEQNFSEKNEPWVFPCVGAHTICTRCKEGKMQVNCPYCPAALSLQPVETLDLFFSFENRVPFCSYCKKHYNLKERFPKELPCGHVLCLQCLKLNYLDKSPKVSKCNTCKTPINNLPGLPGCNFLITHTKFNQVFCTKHRSLPAVCIEVQTLRSWCTSCESSLPKPIFLFKLRSEKISLHTFLLLRFNKFKNLNIDLTPEQFKSLNTQSMLDTIRKIIEPHIAGSLLSSVPSGRRILDPGIGNNKALLIRFLSLMPPKQKIPEFEFFCRPWSVKNGQIEAVVIKADRNFKLEGILLAQPVYNTLVKIDLVEVIRGSSLENQALRVFSSSFPVEFSKNVDLDREQFVNFNSDGSVQVEFFQGFEEKIAKVSLRPAVELKAGEEYSLVIRVAGENVLLYRGNPFDLKEELWGSDGTLFKFSGVSSLGGYAVDGQHDFNGPIIGLIYE